MTPSIEELQAKIAELEKRLGIGEYDPAKAGYKVLVKLLHQQNEYLDTFSIKNNIASEDKDKQLAYKNAKDLWENLPDNIRKVNALKIELKMEGEEKKTTYTPVNAKSIANGTKI
jgi:hypothetical protein